MDSREPSDKEKQETDKHPPFWKSVFVTFCSFILCMVIACGVAPLVAFIPYKEYIRNNHIQIDTPTIILLCYTIIAVGICWFAGRIYCKKSSDIHKDFLHGIWTGMWGCFAFCALFCVIMLICRIW